jgi:hypothetical protein
MKLFISYENIVTHVYSRWPKPFGIENVKNCVFRISVFVHRGVVFPSGTRMVRVHK